MRRAQWTGVVLATMAAVSALPGAASAATGPRPATKAYVAALEAGDARRACTLIDPSTYETVAACRRSLRVHLRVSRLARARIEEVFARRGHARAVVGAVVVARGVRNPRAAAARARLLLRRVGGRWLVRSAGALPGPLPYPAAGPSSDPGPSARTPALRRLADDELLSLSGNADMLCGLLAPGAPLGGDRGACRGYSALDPELDEGLSLRMTRFVEHRIDTRHARIDATIAVTRAVGRRARPGYALVGRRWTDTLFAVRLGDGRWKLVKPSRSFYRVVGQPPPGDVATPAPVATWPLDDAGLPSLTETPMPAVCRTPPALWGAHTCGQVDALAGAPRAGGGGLVAWSIHFGTGVRSVAAGAASAPTTAVHGSDPSGDTLWHVVDRGLIPVAGGALLIEEEEATRAVRVVPLDGEGHPRGAARILDPGVENPDDGEEPTVAVGPPDAASAVVVLGDGSAKRLGPDGGDAGAGMTVDDIEPYYSTLAVLPDGSLLTIDSSEDGTGVRRLGADGRAAGPTLVQPPAAGADETGSEAPAVAVDAAGHVLIVWRERHGRRVELRGWVYDPAAPTASAPFTVAGPSFRQQQGDEDFVPAHPAALAVAALPGGAGWSLAYSEAQGQTWTLWAMRLSPSGATVTPPLHVSDRLRPPQYGQFPFALAGDTLAWQSGPRVAGVAQVRSAPLP